MELIATEADRERPERREGERERAELEQRVGEPAPQPEHAAELLLRGGRAGLAEPSCGRSFGVVARAPGRCEHAEQRPARGARQLVHPRGVALDEIGVVFFAGVRVVEHVVLVDPRLGDHPVGPVDEAPPASREHAARMLRLHPRHAVVTTMADVVHEHPTRAAPDREPEDRDGVRPHPRRGQPERGGLLAPAFHLLEVREIVGPERLEDALAQRLHVSMEGLGVDPGALGVRFESRLHVHRALPLLHGPSAVN
jgi:hypothetical protein